MITLPGIVLIELLVLLRARKRLARYAATRAPCARESVAASLPRLGIDPDTNPHIPKVA